MTWAARIRTLHRWSCVVFTAMVVANFAVMPVGSEALGMAVGGSTLLPLAVLLGTGLYLFVLPYLRT